jgi:hypothetical protein
VSIKDNTDWEKRLTSTDLWHHVTLTPEEIKIIVFNKGTSQGLKG